MGEVGAAAGLNFFAAEFGDILVTLGSNAAIAERLHTRLGRELPPSHLCAAAARQSAGMRPPSRRD